MARKVGLALDTIVAAAARVADEDGLDGVTLAAVAARVGVRSPSLYAHVEGLEGLKRALALHAAAALARRLTSAARGRRGIDALAAIAAAYRAFARAHPGQYAATQRAVRPGEDDALYQALAGAVAPALTAMEEAGVPPRERVHLARAMRAAMHGFVDLERAGGFGMPTSVEQSYRRLITLLLAGVRETAADGHHPGSRSR